MGTPKAALEWHSSTLLWRTVAITGRAVGGPVVVVRAPGQDLPALPPGTEVTQDAAAGRGPLQGIAAGLAALAGRAEVAFVAATDLPFLHPAFIRRVMRAACDGADVALPVARGYRQPLAAAYRTALAPAAGQLVMAGQLKPAFLFARCRVELLDETALRADPVLAALDPELDSVLNVNEPADYHAARARPAPEVIVSRLGVTSGRGQPGPQLVRAAALAQAAAGAGVTLGDPVVAVLNGATSPADPQCPLAAGDTVLFVSAGTGGGRP